MNGKKYSRKFNKKHSMKFNKKHSRKFNKNKLTGGGMLNKLKSQFYPTTAYDALPSHKNEDPAIENLIDRILNDVYYEESLKEILKFLLEQSFQKLSQHNKIEFLETFNDILFKAYKLKPKQ